MTESSSRYQKIRLVTIVGAIVNLLLAIVKIIIGYIGHSHALLVDGIHSLSDLLSDALVIFAAKHGDKSPDEDHPYGHARIETFFTVVFGVFLVIVGIGIIIDAIGRLSDQGGIAEIPTTLTLLIALISVISKEILYQYTMYYGNSLNSSLLKANAWHHRTDAISSIVVLVGIAGSIYAIPYLDIVAAVIVAMMIAKIGWDFVYDGVNELVDKGLDNEELQRIRKIIEEIPDVRQMHLLRTRQMANNALVDVHVQVAPDISVSEGHRISDEVSRRLINHVDVVSQVLVHIDCEDDEEHSSCYHLPLRDEVIQQLQALLSSLKLDDEQAQELLDQVISRIQANEEMILHYHNAQIRVELFLPEYFASKIQSLKQVESAINAAMAQTSDYQSIRFLVDLGEQG